MRILLVGPDQEENLSIRYLSASAQAAGHVAHLARFNSASDLAGVVAQAAGYDLVGLSLCFQSRAREFLDLASALAGLVPRPRIVAGGHFATCAARELLTFSPAIDVVVLHEGEDVLVQLADGVPPEQVPGVLYREGAEVRESEQRRSREDLAALPFPDRTGTMHLFAGVPTTYLMGSRGCVARCDYCCIATLHRTVPGRRYRVRPPENVADEMAEQYHGRGIRQFVFHDDNFLVPDVRVNLERIDAYARAWAARGMTDIGFTIKCRPPDADEAVFRRLRDLGLLRVFFGIESASAEGLASIGRRQTVAQNEHALDLAHRLGISAQYTLMAFHPDATRATVRTDLAFLRRHLDHAINVCRAEIYAGTPLLHRMVAEGRARGDWLAHTYRIADPAVERASTWATRIFQERAWSTGGLMERVIGLDHLAAVLGRFYAPALVSDLRRDIRAWRLRANQALVDLLEETTEACFDAPTAEDPELLARLRDIVRRERDGRRAEMQRARALHAELDRIVLPATGIERRSGRLVTRPEGGGLARHAAAVFLALSVGNAACHGGVSEYAAPPLEDTDGDGLPDQCEVAVFGTDPNTSDSDSDGVGDAAEDSDDDGVTNAAEQSAVGYYDCPPVDDEGAP